LQNGKAERCVGNITRTARTLLLHTMECWSSTVTKEFLPFTIRHACTIHNASVSLDTGKSPHHMLIGSLAPWWLKDFRVFGSHVYVLDKWLQDGDSLPKWKARSWLGVYVWLSLVHAGNVPIIYNPLTTHVSPQFHVVFDDQFTPVVGSTLALSDNFYQSLNGRAKWLYSSKIDATLEDYYIFDDYWMDPPLSSKKCTTHHISPPDAIKESAINANTIEPIKKTDTQKHAPSTTTLRNQHACTPGHLECIKPKLNLVPVPSGSAHLGAWKAFTGINAEVHRIVHPTDSDYNPPILDELSAPASPTISPHPMHT
jgi:hypothetical protein